MYTWAIQNGWHWFVYIYQRFPECGARPVFWREHVIYMKNYFKRNIEKRF
jgi:hypothetical protein